ncbi:hypothetical protein [Nocardia sp. CDC160]|uniref:hypothetical protein n=1 Tax=Nocardia sp. CDC160 TaxID=3112166 RepID=UPI002DBC470F|nr:hypothetical protein [Nocardia sp. CDC160]MEC3919194.1 hypothetical protein [Nocardia sp. CDC160]
MNSRTYSRIATIVAISCSTGTLVGVPGALASPDSKPEKLCTITYPTPDDFTITASTEVFVRPTGVGRFTLTAHTDAKSQTPYDQRFQVTWSNLDTGKNGQDETSAKVQGSDNVLTIPNLATGPGRIPLVLGIANHGSGPNYTNGDCQVEYKAE